MSYRPLIHHIILGALSTSLLLSVACGGGDDDASSDAGDGGGATATTAGDAKDTPSGESGAKFDPCQLLTGAELEEFAGEKMDGGDPAIAQGPMGITLCTWGATSERSLTIAQVSVVREQDFSAQLKSQKYTVKNLFEGEKALHTSVQDVAGIGESAYRVGNVLNVLYDGMTVSVSLGKQGVETETLLAMANKAVARIP
ncbi:MAG: DUF3558 family protein [Dehalococcoidia bacterium]|nr:DUF3558 family protein [Dehalococcoidia bacterium]